MATSTRGKDGKKARRLSIDLRALQAEVVAQFQGLDPKEPGQWPLLPKIAAWVGVTLATVLVGWLMFVGDGVSALNGQRDLEPGLKSDYGNKLRQAINLSELRKQLPTHRVFPLVPIPVNECSQRLASPPKGCTNVSGS